MNRFMTSCTTDNVAFLLDGFTWDLRIAPTTVRRSCQRNLNEQQQDPPDWPGAISLPAPISAPMIKIHLQALKPPLALLWLLKFHFFFLFSLPLVVKYNPGYKYTRDTLWLNSPIGKKLKEMFSDAAWGPGTAGAGTLFAFVRFFPFASVLFFFLL